MVRAPLARAPVRAAENRSSASHSSESSSLSAARRKELSAGSQMPTHSTVASPQRTSIMKSRT